MTETASPSRRKIVSLSLVFPNPGEPQLGLFVRSRLVQVASRMDICVVAPIPRLDYGRFRQGNGLRSQSPPEETFGPLRILHPRWFYPPGGSAWNAWFLERAVRPALGRLRATFPFELIDAHFAYPDGIAAAMLAGRFGCPFTITLRGNETMHAGHPAKRARMRWAMSNAAAVIAVSENLRRFALEMGVPGNRAFTIPNGIDGSIYHPRDREELRRRLGVPAGRKVILSAGYLIERKGHHRAVLAIRDVLRQGIDAELWIAGGPGREGDYRGEIEAAIAASNLGAATKMLGAVTPAALAEYMSAADLFCLASSREGWVNVVNEALACGTPVVATAVGGVPEMLPGSDFGIVVAPGDQAALAQAVAAGLNRFWDREAIARRGGARRWEQVGEETASVLEDAIRQPPTMKG